jgi:tryptophan-rich sensory protein
VKKFNWIALLGFIIASEIIGSLGSIFTIANIPTWYNQLTKPPLNPPNWIFGPVWTLLFALMGMASYLVWQKGWEKKKVRAALCVFLLQFILNVAWSFFFFGWRNPFLGLLDILLLLATIILTISKFLRIYALAGALLIPYLLWCSFATYLNFAILILNR